MASELKCKITVLKRSLHTDLIHQYLEDEYHDRDYCEMFEEGQEFIFDGYDFLTAVPEGFCLAAWADIRQDVFSIMNGSDIPGMKEKGVIFSGCTDWFRPVIFKIERIEIQ